MRYRLLSWLRPSWRTAAALSLVFALVGGLALTLLAGAYRTVTAPDRYSASRGAAFDVTIQQPAGRPRATELDGLAATGRLETATFVFGGLTASDGQEVDTVVFAGMQEPLGTRLIDGRLPDPADPSGFVATARFVDNTRARIGDHYKLQTLTQEQADASGFGAESADGPSLDATLVGVIDGPSDLEDGFQVALFPSSLLDQGDVGVSATIAVASLTPGATVDDLRAQLSGLPGGDSFSIDTAPWISDEVRAAVNAQGQGVLVLGAVVAITAVVVLGQLLSRQLRLSDVEQSVLSTVGFTRLQVLSDALSRAAVVAVVGALGACAIAYGASGRFPLDFARRVEPSPGRRFDPLGHVLGPVALVVAVLAWMLVSSIFDRATSRMSTTPTVVDRLIPVVSNPQATTGLQFAFGPQAGRRRSGRASLVGLAIVFAVMAGALSFGVNLDRLVNEPARWGDNFDFAIDSGEAEISDEVRNQLDASADVGALTLYGTSTAAVGSASLDIIGMELVKGDLVPVTLAGRLPQGDDEIALGSVAAGDLGVHVGDSLTLAGTSGPRTLQVTGISVNPSVGGADKVGRSGLVTADGFVAIDPGAKMSTAAVRATAGDTAARERIGALLGQPVGQSDLPPAILNLHRVRTMPFALAAAVGFLAMISLGHVMIVAVRRRRRELATLGALGAHRRWLSSVVHWQATLITVAVLVVALPIGSIAGSALCRQFMTAVGADPATVQPVVLLTIAFFVLVVAANVVAAVPARRARRIAPARALADE